MAPLFKVIMDKYEENYGLILNWMLFRQLSIRDCQVLLAHMCRVLDCRRAWTDADTPEQTALAAWARNNAIEDLHSLIRKFDVPDNVRMAIIYVTTHNY